MSITIDFDKYTSLPIVMNPVVVADALAFGEEWYDENTTLEHDYSRLTSLRFDFDNDEQDIVNKAVLKPEYDLLYENEEDITKYISLYGDDYMG